MPIVQLLVLSTCLADFVTFFGRFTLFFKSAFLAFLEFIIALIPIVSVAHHPE